MLLPLPMPAIVIFVVPACTQLTNVTGPAHIAVNQVNACPQHIQTNLGENNYDPLTMRHVGSANMLASYCIPVMTETVVQPPAAVTALPTPPAHFAAHETPPGIPMDSAMEVIDQLESMNLLDLSLSITDVMQMTWSVHLANKYPYLLWALLNEPSHIKALMAPDIMLSAPAVL
uniref:Uncharacterized protein n=1 Tax=Romanomermis culicivorax TaxID=13658 RepID=A0A915IIB4_ROMCU